MSRNSWTQSIFRSIFSGMDTSPSPSAAISSTDDPVAKPTPFDLAANTITRREQVELKTAAAHYKRLHGDATKRIERLRAYHQRELSAWQERYKGKHPVYTV